MDSVTLDEESLQQLYAWIDEIPLSRPKKSITRDFSDGVLVAELVNHFIPRLADLHNYAPANALLQKMENWKVLNRKLFSKLNYSVPESVVNGVCGCKAGLIEVVLYNLRKKIEAFIAKRKAQELIERNQIYDEINELNYLGPAENGLPYSYADGPPYPVQHSGLQHNNQQQMGYANFNGFKNDPHNQHVYNNTESNVHQQITSSPQISDNQQHQRLHQHQQYMHNPNNFVDDQVQQVANKLQMHKGNHYSVSDRSHNQHNIHKVNVDSTNKQKKIKTEEKSMIPTRSHSMQDMGEVAGLRISLAEKEQALLASQETVQILQVKIRRLEHLLHLKDLRLEDMNHRLSNPESNNQRTIPQPSRHHVNSNSPQHSNFRPHPPLPSIRRDSDRSEKRSPLR